MTTSKRVSPTAAYGALLNAGAGNVQASVLVAIGLAESGLNPSAVGDVGLETSTWGPSYGVWQIRTLKSDTGTGSPRDINRLKKGLPQQAAAAVSILHSSGLRAWSTYTSGAYRRYLGSSSKVGGVPASALKNPGLYPDTGKTHDGITAGPRSSTGSDGGVSPAAATAAVAGITNVGLLGGLLDPFNWPGAAAGEIGKALGGVGSQVGGAAIGGLGAVLGAFWQDYLQPFALTSFVVIGGIGLVVIGFAALARSARTSSQSITSLLPAPSMGSGGGEAAAGAGEAAMLA
jgi:hypothetical protein